jgi:hypothetical protein
MRSNLIIFLLILFIVSSGVAQDSTKVSGLLIDSYSKKILPNMALSVSSSFGTDRQIIKTDSNGKFNTLIPRNKLASISYNGSRFIEKSIYIRSNDESEQVQFTLRSTNGFPITADIDSTLISQKIGTMLKNYNLELSDLNPIFEPPGICRGFIFQLADSTTINVFIQRTVWLGERKRSTVAKEKIIGLAIAKLNGEVEAYGTGKPLISVIRNKYFEE